MAAALLASCVPNVAAANPMTQCAKDLTAAASVTARRSITADDLVRLRDLGQVEDSTEGDGPLGLSPDARRVAFQLRRGNPATNSYCLGLFVLDAERRTPPILVDEGGELVRLQYDFRGKAGFSTGLPVAITPRWTPDGRAILFLKRLDGRTRVWLARADGKGSRPLTDNGDDIVDFRLATDGRSILYRTQPGLRKGLADIDREASRGFHYDDRYSPMTSSRPFVSGPLSYAVYRQSIVPSDDGLATAAPAIAASSSDWQTEATVRSAWGDEAAIIAGKGAVFPRANLAVRFHGSPPWTCPPAACEGVSQLWWTKDRRLRFLRRDGWAREDTAIYEWRRGETDPRRIFRTRDLLTGCSPVAAGVICAREASDRPRYIARIDLPSGRDTVLFDPNPDFAQISLGHVQRLHWRNALRLEVFGDLVLPTDYVRGRRYPLVVVQYQSRGFLRGGTGDEYPIQLFAARGYVVLSFNRPINYGQLGDPRDMLDAERRNLANFADRRSVLSALEAGVDLLIERGIVDPARMGITGLSDGASTVQFALVNRSMFKVAAMSSCCWDASYPISVGPGAAEHFYEIGYPGVLSQDDPFWKPIAFTSNADRIKVPILLQLADSEYMSALTSYTALRARQAPIDLYVFPDETHVKWQPAHRLAVYERNLAWFDFWLNDRTLDADAEAMQRWQKLRTEIGQDGVSEPPSAKTMLPH